MWRALLVLLASCVADVERDPAEIDVVTPEDGRMPPAEGGGPFAYTPCPHPDDVTWMESSWDPVTAALPAGVYFEDPIGGCLSVIVRSPLAGWYQIDATVHGCATTLQVPQTFHLGDAGIHAYGEGNETFGISAEYCSGIVAISGGIGLAIDTTAATLTSGGLQGDTSSAPHYNCGCTP
jgi:hypothetical protein